MRPILPNILRYFITLIASIAICPCSAWASISAVDGRGKRVELPAPPVRIVSLTPSNTEILFALGLKGRIIADTSQCDYPPEARNLPHIGDYRISVEQGVAQKPDLVVAVTSANHTAIDKLEQLRVKVFAVDPRNIAELYGSIISIGEITGTRPCAEMIVNGMRARINDLLRRVAKTQKRPGVLVVVQSQPLMVAGSENFLDEAVTLAGGINLGREAGKGFPLFSPEIVIARKPDVILGRPELRDKPGWSRLPAVRNNAVYQPPKDTLSRPTPRLVQAVEYIARKLHPEVFPANSAQNPHR